MAFTLEYLRDFSLLTGAKCVARIRDSRIPIVLERIGLLPEEAVTLNVADAYAGRRVSRKVRIPESSSAQHREVRLDRATREAMAVILESNVEAGYPLHPGAPLFIEFEAGCGTPGQRLSAVRLRQILEGLQAAPSA